MEIPQNLIIAGSKLRVWLDRRMQVNRTAAALVISGTQAGFLSLANSLLFAFNELEDQLPLSKLSFVHPEVNLIVRWDDSTQQSPVAIPGLICTEPSVYLWQLSHFTFYEVVGNLHSLGYANKEIHFDRGLAEEVISVYCVVEEGDELRGVRS